MTDKATTTSLTLEEWIEREFAQNSRPSLATVRRWVREGHLPATKMGKRLYIRSDTTLTARRTGMSIL